MSERSNRPPLMESAPPRTPWYLWPNVLGLDAPIIALLWFFLLARAHDMVLEPSVPWILFLVVWAIYVADRWFDVHRGIDVPETPRHRFQETRGGLWLRIAAGLGACWAAWLSISEMPVNLLYFGAILGGLVVVHLAISQLPERPRGGAPDPITVVLALALLFALALFFYGGIPIAKVLFALIGIPLCLSLSPRFRMGGKELRAGGVFALGTFLPAYFHHRDGWPLAIGITTLLFGALCVLNCALVSLHEEDEDGARTFLDPWLLPILALVAGLLPFWGTITERLPFLTSSATRTDRVDPEVWVWGCLAVSAILLFLLHCFRRQLSGNALRTLVDAALLTPVFVLPMLS